jgi:hypothetical protein
MIKSMRGMVDHMQISRAEFSKRPATHIVSLGQNCATAYNLRRHFDFGAAFPFDWWIVSADGLTRFLTNPDVEFLYDTSQLELARDASSVQHREFGFRFYHEFPRRSDLPDARIREDWREFIERPKQRAAALVAKLMNLNASGNRIAFVREGPSSPDLADQLDRLFPLAETTLAVLEWIPGDQGDPLAWKGDSARWDATLNTLELTLDRAGHRPFTEIQGQLELSWSSELSSSLQLVRRR